jgi:hypothetical protein
VTEGLGVQSCDTLAGAPVLDARREAVGIIDELLVDVASGRLVYVILSCGGHPGAGGGRVVVPWRWLRWEPGRRQFSLTVDRPTLASALAGPAGLAEDDWLDLSDGGLLREIARYFDAHETSPRPTWRDLSPSHH